MIYLTTNTPKIYNDLADVVRLFYDNEQVKLVVHNDILDSSSVTINHIQNITNNSYTESYVMLQNNVSKDFTYEYKYTQNKDTRLNSRIAKRSAKLGLYYALKLITGRHLPWGTLTGIRPVGLYRQLNAHETLSAHMQFETMLDVSKPKIDLVEEIIANQKNIYFKGNSQEIDVYIGIPFCPTRCIYCSFISHDLSIKAAPIDEYVDCILKEIDTLEHLVKRHSKHIRCLYFGGGTPTTLGYKHLDTILAKLAQIIDSQCEITVEAGRVDTICDDILRVLKEHNVDRISINPQTFNDDTLKLVNRAHSSKDIFDAFEKAATYNFPCINTDLIMGLPRETKAHMEHTLECVKSLPIQNLTIHTLAIKRASKIKTDNYNLQYASQEIVAEMIDRGRQLAAQMDMYPYYLYRQKYMSGNLENVGYSKNGKQCVYNIDIMEETHNLVAIGAGAISKRFFYNEKRHTRFSNPKSVEHYIKNIGTIIDEKQTYFEGF